MNREAISVGKLSEDLERKKFPISLVMRGGEFIFVSGTPPLDPTTGLLQPGDIRHQTAITLEAVKACLEAAGSSLDKVIKTTVWITNAAYFDSVNDVYRSYFPNDPPARSFVTVQSWPREFDIEIDAIAIA